MEDLYSSKMTKNVSSATTQKFIDVAEVKDNVMVLKNGSLRAVLAVSAINYELKSTDEQTAIISQYQNFLNSLDFPVQIMVSSRKMNIDSYVDFISQKEKEQPNELLRLQTSEYSRFIKELVSVSNIMDKTFYIIVPFSPIESTESGFLSNVMSRFNPQKNILEKRENFETYKNQLFQRVDHVITALGATGVKIIPLETQDIIELLFNAYNPQIFESSNLADVNKLELKN
jgi:type IV secretory pathway VirB4 component